MNYGIMFSSAGFGELLLRKSKYKCKVANELLEGRMTIHNYLYPDSIGVKGDIMDEKVYADFKEKFIESNCEILVATPPCQGFSLIGKNKNNDQMLVDERNFLIFRVIQLIKETNVKFCLIENVPRFLEMKYNYNGDEKNIEQILISELGEKYNIEIKIFNALEFEVPQNRSRAIIKIYKKSAKWKDPKLSKKVITMEEAIGHLPSIESGENSDLKWHFGRKHSESHVICMRHTPTGATALDNEIYFPKNSNGEKVKAYQASYRRLNWNKPCPTITMRNDAISSQSNVHPGRKLKDGTYSDARVLSIRELFILSSIPEDLDLPENLSEIQIRHLIGEGVPPKMMFEIMLGINND